MKRSAFITVDSRDSYGRVTTKQTTRQARQQSPISVGVIVGDGTYHDVVLELEVRNDGRWSLVRRIYGQSGGDVVAEGTIS